MVNAAVLLFGLAGVLGKVSALLAPLIVLARVMIATPALAIVARLSHVSLRPRRARDLAILVGQGGLLAVHWTTFFQSINVSSVAIGLLSFSSFPLFTAALEPALLRQRPSAIQIAGALLVLPGIYLLVPSFTLSDATTAGVLWGLAAGATFALLSITNRALTRSYSSLAISLYQDGVAAIVLLPALLFVRPSAPPTSKQLLALLILGLACTALAHTLFIAGLRTLTAQLASLIASLEPVWGILFAQLLLGETPTTRTLAGGTIILAATMLPAVSALTKGRTSRTQRHPRRHPRRHPSVPSASGRVISE
jgi:drug/metabolite transporter (DMT)-like permease